MQDKKYGYLMAKQSAASKMADWHMMCRSKIRSKITCLEQEASKSQAHAEQQKNPASGVFSFGDRGFVLVHLIWPPGIARHLGAVASKLSVPSKQFVSLSPGKQSCRTLTCTTIPLLHD